jgi:hypothetical protein
MKALLLAKALALAALFTLTPRFTPAQTEQQLAEVHQLTEADWSDTLNYGEWLLNAQFWLDHSDSSYAKEFFAGLDLTPTDQSAFRTIVTNFNQRHNDLMAASYAKLATPAWTPEAQTELIKDLVDATHDAMQQIKSDLTPSAAQKVAAAALSTDPYSNK